MLKETDALKVFDKSGAGKLSYEDLTNVVDGDKEGQEQPRPPAPPSSASLFCLPRDTDGVLRLPLYLYRGLSPSVVSVIPSVVPLEVAL